MVRFNKKKTDNKNKKPKSDKKAPAAGKKHSAQGDKRTKPLNLKLQLFVGFAIPVLIVIVVGISAYNQAAKGLIETYETSTFSSIEMATQLIDAGLQSMTSNAVDIANHSSFLGYIANNSGLDSLQAQDDIKGIIVTNSNDFIRDIHIIPNSSSTTLSTSKTDVLIGEEIYADVRSDMEEQCSSSSSVNKWGAEHLNLDSRFKLDSSAYAGFFCMKTSFKDTLIVMDINQAKIESILTQLALGENSIVCYQTKEGKEVLLGQEGFTFTDKDYAQNALTSNETAGSAYVTQDGVEYLYMYSRCNINHAMISALVPKSVITAEADNIRTTVIVYVIIACIIVGIIGMLILLNLNRNLKEITGGLVKASQGDLTFHLNFGGKSEFAMLAKHVMETVSNTKNLIASVQHTTGDVSASSENVGKLSDVIQTSVEAISDALEEINSGVSQEANDAEECLMKMDALSGKIIHTSSMITEVESVAENTKQMAQSGFDSMESLIEHSRETSVITATVNEKVDQLIEHSMQIEEFVTNINDIADQTTLLSLNASIEAARAGEMGRGFTVVAEEIKKLSENSMESAQAIKDLVSKIHVMTDDTKTATQKSQAIVENQQEMVAATKQMFLDMNGLIEHLLDNMRQVSLEIQSMDADRADTLNSIQNISGVIEETLASTTVVSEKIREQASIMDGLTSATTQLNDNTSELNRAVGKFTL